VSPQGLLTERALGGLGHKEQLDPFAALFVAGESLPDVLVAFSCAHPLLSPLCSSPLLVLRADECVRRYVSCFGSCVVWLGPLSSNKKGATGGPRLVDQKLCLYIQNIKLEREHRQSWRLYIVIAFRKLSAIVYFLPIDKISVDRCFGRLNSSSQ
jgi:hypothetical protein